MLDRICFAGDGKATSNRLFPQAFHKLKCSVTFWNCQSHTHDQPFIHSSHSNCDSLSVCRCIIESSILSTPTLFTRVAERWSSNKPTLAKRQSTPRTGHEADVSPLHEQCVIHPSHLPLSTTPAFKHELHQYTAFFLLHLKSQQKWNYWQNCAAYFGADFFFFCW